MGLGMKHRMFLFGWSVAFALLGSFAWSSEPTKSAHFRIMATTDLHCALMDFDDTKDVSDPSLGLVRTATLIRQARAEISNALLVDNGDLLQGTLLGDFIARKRSLADGQLHPMIEAMNALGYDAANVGNHDLNYGLDFLRASVDGASFPFVCANLFGDVDGETDPWFPPYVVVSRTVVADDGSASVLRIGLIGVLPPQVMRWDRSHLDGRARAGDMVQTVRRLVPEIRKKADIIVLLAHSGLGPEMPRGMDENAALALSQVGGVDAIVFGHAHQFFPGHRFEGMEALGVDNSSGRLNGVPAVMPGMYGSHLGIIDMNLTWTEGRWSVAEGHGFLRPIAKRVQDAWEPCVPPDEETARLARRTHALVREWIRQPLGEIERSMSTFFSLVCDTPAMQLIADAQGWAAARLVEGSALADLPLLSVAAPFKAGGSRADQYTRIPAGPIAYRHVADLYPYPNTLTLVKMNGAEIRDWLDMSAGIFRRIDPQSPESQPLLKPDFPTFNFDVFKGVSYQIDVTRAAKYDAEGQCIDPDTSRIRALTYQGRPLTSDQWFLVATNSYRASGGGSFPHLSADRVVLETSMENRSAIADYLRHMGKISGTCDANWRLTPWPQSAQVTLTSSASSAALEEAEATPGIRDTGVRNDRGYAVYRIVPSP